MCRLPALLTGLALAVGVTPASGQYADQKALEAAVRALHEDPDARIVVSPRLVAPNVDGNVRIDDENREVLVDRLGAEVLELESAVVCDDLARPDTCAIDGGGTIYQFFMPEPLRGGVLHLAVMLLKEGEADGPSIRREWWNLALVREAGVGWTVVDRSLQDTADGPW